MTRPRHDRSALALLTVMAVGVLALASPATWAQQASRSWEPYPDSQVNPDAPTNGCGSQGDDGIDVPDDWWGVPFSPACDWHDKCYGTKGMTQKYCDLGMWHKIQEACGSDLRCRQMGDMYHLAVSTLGEDAYNAGQARACPADPTRSGRAHGDPHLATFDGSGYDFMTAGVFTLVADAGGRDLVQARFLPRNDQFTIVDGVAVRLGDHEVVVQMDPDTATVEVYVDGTFMQESIVTFEEGFVDRGEQVPGVHQVVTIRSDAGMRVEALVFDTRIDVSVNLHEPMWAGVSGLLGDADGDPANDLVDESGTVVDVGNQFTTDFTDVLYGPAFVDAWRVTSSDSMFPMDPDAVFDFHGDEALEWPREVTTIEDLFGDGHDAARAQCAATGLEGDAVVACTFDLLVSGDQTYAATAAASSARSSAVAAPTEVAGVGVDPASRPEVAATIDESSPLVEALFRDDMDEFRRLLEDGEQIDVVPPDGRTPLVAAIALGNVAAARLLLDAGASPTIHADRELTHPLSVAAFSGSVPMVELLLDAGVDPDDHVADAGTPLAVGAQHPEVVEVLLAAGADPNPIAGGPPPLNAAAILRAAESVQLLVDAGADVNFDSDPSPATSTPLVNAVIAGDVDVVRILVQAGANTDVRVSPGVPLSLYVHDDEIRDLLDG